MPTDAFIRDAWAIRTRDKTDDATEKMLKHVFQSKGYIEHLHQGAVFESIFIKMELVLLESKEHVCHEMTHNPLTSVFIFVFHGIICRFTFNLILIFI